MEYLPPESAAFLAVRDALERTSSRCRLRLHRAARRSSTPSCSYAGSASRPTSSARRCTRSTIAAAGRVIAPEGTAGVMRAVIQHGLDRGALPIKLWYAGPFFRAERRNSAATGSFSRSVSRPSASTIRLSTPRSSRSATTDSGRSGLPTSLLRSPRSAMRNADPRIARNSSRSWTRSTSTTRPAPAHRLNPLRVLDDKRPEVRAQLDGAPLIVDHLCSECADHFAAVRAYLDALRVHYTLNPRLVRGLDYYTKTTFEFVHHGLGVAIRHRRRWSLRRPDGRARRPGLVGNRLRSRHRSRRAGLSRGGPRGRRERPESRCSSCRSAMRPASRASPRWGNCAVQECTPTWLTAPSA